MKKKYIQAKKTVRVNWTIDVMAFNLISKAGKHNGHSMSKIVSELILQKLSNPIRVIDGQLRDYAKKINDLQQRKKELQRDYKEGG